MRKRCCEGGPFLPVRPRRCTSAVCDLNLGRLFNTRRAHQWLFGQMPYRCHPNAYRQGDVVAAISRDLLSLSATPVVPVCSGWPPPRLGGRFMPATAVRHGALPPPGGWTLRDHSNWKATPRGRNITRDGGPHWLGREPEIHWHVGAVVRTADESQIGHTHLQIEDTRTVDVSPLSDGRH